MAYPLRFCLQPTLRLCISVLAMMLAACSNSGPSGVTTYHPSMSYGPTGLPSGTATPYQPGQTTVAPQAVQQPREAYYISPRPVTASSSAPAIRAEAYLLIDARTGAHLASRNPDQRRAVASTQKLLTALVVLDAGQLDKVVTIAGTDLQVEPTRLGIRSGDRYTRRNLLYAFLIKSSNDVAKALARDHSGSSAAFAQAMNAKMAQLGAHSSHFANPHGLTEPGQYSTARDMGRLAMAAYRQPLIRDAISRRSFSFRYSDGRTITLKNTNDLLGVMPECNGMKTGYTVASGRCLISSASGRGRDVILVQLGSKTAYIFEDARRMMEWGLRQAGSRALSQNPVETSDEERLTASR